MENQDITSMEVVQPTVVEAQERAQIDMAVATAKRYPRQISRFLAEAKSAIQASKEIAESCRYRLKRKDKDGGIKWIEGPSIRLMEIAASSYGNLRYGSREVSEDDRFVICQGAASDMEKNVHISVTVKRRITTKTGQKYSDDMVGVTANAAGAIARRNALRGVIPTVYINELEREAKKVTQGDIKTLPERLKKAVEKFKAKYDISEERLLAYLEKPKFTDCNLDDLDKLIGAWVALEEGDYKVDEVFPVPGRAAKFDEGKKKEEDPPKPPEETTAAQASGAAEAPELFPSGEKKKRKPSAPKEEAQQASPAEESLAGRVLALCEDAGLSEKDVMGFMRDIGAIDESLSSLVEVEDVMPSALREIIRGWKIHAKKMIELRDDEPPMGEEQA